MSIFLGSYNFPYVVIFLWAERHPLILLTVQVCLLPTINSFSTNRKINENKIINLQAIAILPLCSKVIFFSYGKET